MVFKAFHPFFPTIEKTASFYAPYFAEKKISMKEKEGWRSTAYRLRVPRTTVSFDIDKKDSDAVRYITILYPSKNTASFPIFKAKFLNKAFDENGVKIEISVGGKKRQLEYKL